MANTRKPNKRRKRKSRIVRLSPEPLTKIDQHYTALHECYKAAIKAGFTAERAFWLLTDQRTLPDWITGKDGIIPIIDPYDDEDDD
jgi:hypothetical protein